ncbi:MAG TPA: HAD family hydrolase [Terriglobales bacterium]|nr:HAD family hydrolase [Terriglobales bacterium]
MSLRPAADAVSAEKTENEERQQGPGPQLKTGWVGAETAHSPSQCAVHVQSGFDWTAADAYLFDIDGTLLNSRDTVHYFAFHRAVEKIFGLDFRIDGVPVHGNTDVGILRAYLELAQIPESEWRPRLPEVIELMSSDVEFGAAELRPELCPAILEIIEDLSSRGKLLGVASGNLERVGWAKLRASGLRNYFSFGAFSGQLEKRDDVIAHGIAQARELLGKGAVVYVVGDTPADIHSAHNNDVPAIAVATGIYSVEELLLHKPEMCISCFNDVL